MEKRKLTVAEQVRHLREKGVQFHIIDEAAAQVYLEENSNYFKLASYRKNYQKHPGGPKEGQYVRLEFAYLVDLAEIDRELRYLILQMALDIEHHVKMALLKLVENSAEDGYTIVRNFEESLDARQREILHGEIARNRNNTYCGDLVRKYEHEMPIWVFVELIPFGRLISLYKFCGERFQRRDMQTMFYCLRDCRELRNAAAHSNCVLNDLKHGGARRPSVLVSAELENIETLSITLKRSRMGNERIRQIITLLYMYRTTVTSMKMEEQIVKHFEELLRRMHVHADFYDSNQLIQFTFGFLEIIIDNWFLNR